MRIADAESAAAWAAEREEYERMRPVYLDLATRCAAVVRMRQRAREEQLSNEAAERRAMARADLYSALREESEELQAEQEAEMLKFAFEPFVPAYGDTGTWSGAAGTTAATSLVWLVRTLWLATAVGA